MVSGGAKGIGESIVRGLVVEGAFPIVVGRNHQDNTRILGTIREMGGYGDVVTAELSNPKDCKMAVERVKAKYNRLDGLVNNAEANDSVGLEQESHENFIGSLHINMPHYFLLAHYALPLLKKSKGNILNISSKTAETGQNGTSGYATSNGTTSAMTREWAVELLDAGIRVNAIIVAQCWRPLYNSLIGSFAVPTQKLKSITSKIPPGNRMTRAAEIADMALFLLSERACHTAGQLIQVDGSYVPLDSVLT